MTNRKQTKSALLSSVVALLLCFAMLLGTTFAWFTDTASTSVNTIQAGTLDIALEDIDGNTLEGKTLSWQKAKDHENETVLWEPGCTYALQPIVIKNDGNLALKYKIVITGIKGDAELNDVIDWTIKVDGETYSVDSEFYLTAKETDTLTISGHMQESAGNYYQGKKIEGISIAVYATQWTYEYDSSNNQYDKNAGYDMPWDGTTTAIEKSNDGKYHITSASEFAWLMAQTNGLASIYSNEQIVLDSNIDFGGATITGFGHENVKFSGSFDGQGFTVSNFVIDRADKEDYAGLFNYYSYGTIKNLNVKNATVVGQSKVGALLGSIDDGAKVENCTVENCVVIADRKVGGAVGYAQGAAVNNITVKNTTVYCATTQQANDKDQWGEIIGFKNTGYTEEGNVAGNDVVVVTGISVTTVSNAEELAAALPKGGYIMLLNDIDLKNEPWTPVFMGYGTFDGNGHTIKNLKVTADACSDTGNGYGAALIYWSNGSIINLTIDGAEIEGYHNGGVIVGAMNGYADRIENCHVKNATVTITHKDGTLCGDKAGAVAGRIANGVKSINCTAENCVVKGSRDVGQVFGAASESVSTGCSATNVTASRVENDICDDANCGANIKNEVIGRNLDN